jgi:phosphate starvation-inducible PhoH-like protein
MMNNSRGTKKTTRTSETKSKTSSIKNTKITELEKFNPNKGVDAKGFLKNTIGHINFKSKNQRQKDFYNLMSEKEIIICSGPAGVGKSYLTVLKALDLLIAPDNEFYKIVLTTPAVEADEKHGFLPGDIHEKMAPYTYSTLYLFEKIIGKRATQILMESEFIQIMPLAYMRGINVDNAILIAEEFQNSTKRQMKTLLTRIGWKSKFIVSGDLEQSDRYKNVTETGLYDAMNRLKNINNVGMFAFEEGDIVRNPIISKILENYKED